MTPQEQALALVVEYGWYVFRLHIGHNETVCDGGTASCKTIATLGGEHWSETGSNDPDVVAGWDWSGANGYGIDCGKSGILVADEDPGATWPFNGTRVGSTGRGKHHYYNDILGFGNRANVAPWGVDIRGVGGMVIGPGSWHPHGDYATLDESPLDDLPLELVQALQKPDPKPVGPLAELDPLDALPRLAGVYRRMSEAEPGTRNDKLNKMAGLAAGIWIRLPEKDQIGELSEETIKQHLLEAVPDDGDPAKSRGTIDSGWSYGVEHPVADDLETLQHTIFDATPVLSHIRQAAHSRMVGSGALLCCVLGRVLLEVPVHLQIPPTIASRAPLNLGFSFVGDSGAGKSGTVALSEELLGVGQRFMEIGPGSGEGLIDSFIEEVRVPDPNDPNKTVKVKRVVDPPARYMDVDEIGRMGAIKGREGSSLFSMVRTALTGGALKTANAAAGGRRRAIDRGEYRLVVFAGVQPELSDILLNEEEINAGTPQRFVWVSATDKTIPDENTDWPGSLEWIPTHLEFLSELTVPDFVRREVRTARLKVMREEEGRDPQKGHLLLTQQKVAFALAFLHQETEITQQWWTLAGMIIEWSLKEQLRCRARLSQVQERINIMKGRAAGKQELAKEQVIADEVVTRTKERVLSLMGDEGIAMSALKQRLSTAQCNALGHALGELGDKVSVIKRGRGWWVLPD